jgi:16S rRNA pseudouridine516 synthase
MRLDRFLSENGCGTRSEIKKELKKGAAAVNGTVVRDGSTQVPEGAAVTWHGEEISGEALVYYMLNKPAGVVTATRDPKQRTVMDLLPERRRKDLYPVGRLDRDTEGLLLITNDGPLGHRLLAPGRHVDKVYEAHVRGKVTEREISLFRAGIAIDDADGAFTALPAELEILEVREEEPAGTPLSRVRVTIREGKYHQIKRMFAATGMEVVYLKRLSMGPLRLDPSLAPGECRRLTGAETGVLTGEGTGRPENEEV